LKNRASVHISFTHPPLAIRAPKGPVALIIDFDVQSPGHETALFAVQRNFL
jgi:hypothetical protein